MKKFDELLKDVPTELLQSYLSNAAAERFLAGTDKAGNKITQAAKVEAVEEATDFEGSADAADPRKIAADMMKSAKSAVKKNVGK